MFWVGVEILCGGSKVSDLVVCFVGWVLRFLSGRCEGGDVGCAGR